MPLSPVFPETEPCQVCQSLWVWGCFSGFSVVFRAVAVFRQEGEMFGGSVVRSQFMLAEIGVLKKNKRNKRNVGIIGGIRGTAEMLQVFLWDNAHPWKDL